MNIELFTILIALISMALGAIVTLQVTRYYAKKASLELLKTANELNKETDDIKRYTIWLLEALETLGVIETRQEGDKRIRVKKLSAKFKSSTSTSEPNLEVDD